MEIVSVASPGSDTSSVPVIAHVDPAPSTVTSARPVVLSPSTALPEVTRPPPATSSVPNPTSPIVIVVPTLHSELAPVTATWLSDPVVVAIRAAPVCVSRPPSRTLIES